MFLFRSLSIIVTLLLFLPKSDAQTTLNASRLTDLRPLIGPVKNGCFFSGPAYEAFRKSLIPSFPIDTKRRLSIVAPPGISEILGEPAVKDNGDHTEFVVPVSRGHLNGLKVKYLLVAVGNDNGISVEGIEFDASKAEVAERFRPELTAAKRWAKKHEGTGDSPPSSFAIETRNGHIQIVCDSSN